ncbi:MAG: alanine--tRNA ligase, partial [Salinivirgaceae bacterium]|nr:alanine--tRNA ligase [Salinivirgaceae bacterium]
MNANEIRQTFKDFFASKQHRIVESGPMVVKDDPTLMFTNAGMNQFKDLFLGQAPIKYPRVANSQKCLRVSGKHNDLEEVGHDTYHHTMFEMLGNWSFGDYFKKEAIDWAWELLTDVFKLEKDRLYVTVFEGDKSENLSLDTEAMEIWKNHVPENQILMGNKKDNFWEMGATGPCGPCSEIHIDLRSNEERKKISGASLVNMDHYLVVEVWNLVFIQFNRRDDNSLVPLPAKHVDTGMGFERLCMALQGKKSNYDTDVFQPIIKTIEEISGKKYGVDEKIDIAQRVIADHLRAVSFAIADGQLPSNNKAGYVIRRILRRAIRYAFTFLEQTQPFVCQLVPTLSKEMGDAFPELRKQQEIIEKVIREEENAFLRTLASGIKMMDNYILKYRKSNNSKFDGKLAFEMYDTFGFPLDLTELILKENNFTLDHAGFDVAMLEQKNRSRNASMMETNDWVEILQNETTQFVGYENDRCDTKIVAYRKAKIKGKDIIQLTLTHTPFYAESGGQVGDTGTLETENETLYVTDTQKDNNLIVHTVNKIPENPTAQFTAQVNTTKRRNTESNHSAAHILHLALRQVLGDHVEQKGSLVTPDRLRFDFSHFQKLTHEEITQVEDSINQTIRCNIPLKEHHNVPIDQAKEMGAVALFGEKYGETVRVVKFGESIELCGGTHAASTGQLGLCLIVSESAIAAGIRRIEAITGESALQFIRTKFAQLSEAQSLLKGQTNLAKGIESLIETNQTFQKQIDEVEKEKAKALKEQLVQKIRKHNNINVLTEIVETNNPGFIKDICFQLKNEVSDLYCVLGAAVDGKAMLGVAISENITKEHGLHAGNIIRELAKEVEGGGGGQPFF